MKTTYNTIYYQQAMQNEFDNNPLVPYVKARSQLRGQ
jgi:hypothetical protein